ncbi:phosphatases II [Penicillium angulare]|uniref:Phosphatases II n=1 Tax=Penicillium angulare TaxID=116970 RepID=A0A9W9KK38_9EURO|nr:phosphatases II [Penicillium angulare]
MLRQYRITHIVNMSCEYENAFPNEFIYMRVPAKDTLTERLGPWFYNIAAFIADANKSDGIALVHCQQGVSRSATAILSSLIINERMQLTTAFQLLKSAAHEVEPNPTFLKELRALEKEIHGKCSLEKLTVLDQCDEPATLDWKESIAIILASAALADIPYHKHTKELSCIAMAFDNVKASTSSTESESLLTDFLIAGLESFGGNTERDLRARAALESILAVHLPQCGIITPARLQEMLSGILESESFLDFTMDVPRATSWVKELCQRVKEDTADPGKSTVATQSKD